MISLFLPPHTYLPCCRAQPCLVISGEQTPGCKGHWHSTDTHTELTDFGQERGTCTAASSVLHEQLNPVLEGFVSPRDPKSSPQQQSEVDT